VQYIACKHTSATCQSYAELDWLPKTLTFSTATDFYRLDEFPLAKPTTPKTEKMILL